MPHGDIFIIETAAHYVCLSPKYLKKKITQIITVTRKASRFHMLRSLSEIWPSRLYMTLQLIPPCPSRPSISFLSTSSQVLLPRLTKIASPEPTMSFSSEAFLSRLLRFCSSGWLKCGVSVHGYMIKLGLYYNTFLSNNLLSVYAKFVGTLEAHLLFGEMPHKDVVSWTGIISAYVREGGYDHALRLFDQMVLAGFSPNEYTLSSVLRACSLAGEVPIGFCIHSQLIKSGFMGNSIVGSALVEFYAKCDTLSEALKVFETTNNHDTVSWTIMISACMEVSNWSQAFKLYIQMLQGEILPNEFTFVKLIEAASSLYPMCGLLVHAHSILWGVHMNLIMKTALVDFYAKYQRMEDAVKVVDLTPETDVILWTTLIRGHSDLFDVKAAVLAFCRMEKVEVRPNVYTFSAMISACSTNLVPELGQQFHSRVIKAGFNHEISVGNALIDLYTRCLLQINEGVRLFDEIIFPNVISWTSLIAGYVQTGHVEEAVNMLVEMQISGILPNSVTIVAILSGCRSAEALSQARKLHGYIVKTKVDSNITVANSLLDVYARQGKVEDAFKILNMMIDRDVISYTSLAAAINQSGQHDMALSIIPLMYIDKIKMDSLSLSCFLSSAANLASIESGKQLHSYAVKSNLNLEVSVANGLVDMYGKCGSVSDAYKAFIEILKPNVISWNALIAGLSSNGFSSNALSSFEDMRLSGIQPDGVTFLLVLYACSHAGLADLGLSYFNYMNSSYDFASLYDHYVCLVDLLGRSGRIVEAVRVIETMPYQPDALIFKTLLGSCKVHRNITLGEEMARRALELDPCDPAIYVLLANIYDNSGKLEHGEHIRRMMRERGLKKSPGQSWIEIRNKMYFFAAGDNSSPQINEMHLLIDTLNVKIKNLGYLCPENDVLRIHSEKLAMAFGLLNTPQAAPIRIIKNIRICDDCHSFMQLVTLVVNREIVVRDGNRFHSFNHGECSCRGYW